jgi:toxin ParE1/3/4
MAKLRLSSSARADLVGIRKYSNEQFSTDVANAYFLGFDAVFAMLRRHPFAGAESPDIGADVRCFLHRKHRIFYRVSGDTVLIIRIIHHARDVRGIIN